MSYASATPAQRAALIKACHRVAAAGHRATEDLSANGAKADLTRLGNSDVTIDAQIAALTTALAAINA